MPSTTKDRQRVVRDIVHKGKNPSSKNEKIGVEHGKVGTDIFSGYIDVDYQNAWKDLQKRIDTIDEMIGSDATITAVLDAYKNPIMSSRFYVKPASEEKTDVEIAEMIERNLFQELSGGFKNTLWEVLTMLDYGFSVFEKVYKEKDGMVMLHRMAPRLQSSIEKWAIDGMPWKDGHPAGITQQINNSDDAVDTNNPQIPWDSLMVFTFKKQGNNFEGKSVLRFAYLHWYMKNLLYKIAGVAADRFGVGIPFIKHKTGATDKQIDEYAKLVEALKANEKSYAVFDETVVEFGILTPSGNAEKSSISEMVKHHDRKIYDSILAGFLNLTSGEGGSNALSKDQSSFFLRGLQGIVDYICGVFNEHIKQLVYINYGEQEEYPKLCASDIGQISMDEYVSSLAAAKESGMLSWLPSDEDKMREQLKLAPITDKERDEIEKEKEEMKKAIQPKPEKDEDKDDKEELSEKPVKRFAIKGTVREEAFVKNISDFENYIESEYNTYLKKIVMAEGKIRKALVTIYNHSDVELVDGVRVLAFTKRNRDLQKKAINFINEVQKRLSSELLNGTIQNRLFERTKNMAKNTVRTNLKLLKEIQVNEAQFNSFVHGHVSNVEGVLFNEPRRMKEGVILNYGSQVSVDLAVKNVAGIQFNRNVLKLSTVTHARGAFNAISYDNSVKNGFTMFKTVVPKKKLKEINPSGMTASILFMILAAAVINKRINEKTDGKNTDAITGLNLHHNAYMYYYPIAAEDLEEEEKVAKRQRENFKNQ